MDTKQDIKKNNTYKTISYITYFLLCFSIVAKDYFSTSVSINTLPFMPEMSLAGVNPTALTVLTFALHSILYALWVEILARFVCNSIMRVSFSTINKYQFISIFKGVVAVSNLLLGLFNFMYFAMPFTFRLQPLIEIIMLAITFAILYAIFYKKYLNKKSAPVIFLSLAIPLGLYFILIAV